MGNIISYLKEKGNLSFLEQKLNVVDALILAQFVYFNFEHIVPTICENKKAVSMVEIRKKADYEKLFSVNLYKEELRDFFETMVKSRRFRNMKTNYFCQESDDRKKIQFCAITFFLGDGNVFIAYRGTDHTISGWKEDLDMAYMMPVPSQKRSVEYFEEVTEHLKRNRKAEYFLGGHSKGGNLAVYAAMNCQIKKKDKIRKVYNFDGPGFRPEFLETMDYKSISERVEKIIPQSSFVGMLLQQDENYKVVESNLTGMLQHLPLTWRVTEGDFVYKKEMKESRKLLNDEINNWILGLNKEELNHFLELIYELIDSTEVKSVTELGENWLVNIMKLFNYYQENRFDDHSRKIFWESAFIILKLVVEDGTEKVRRMGIMQSFREKLENVKKETPQ